MSVRAILVGLPGTGKTTTGRRLAKLLGVPFADTDELVEAAAGRSVREVFATDGEGTFRRLEAEAVATALHEFDGVLALGGGALTTPETLTAVRESGVPVVCLQAPVRTLAVRVGDGRSRPLLQADPVGRLDALAQEREPLFAAVATTTVSTQNRTPRQVAQQIANRLAEGVAR